MSPNKTYSYCSNLPQQTKMQGQVIEFLEKSSCKANRSSADQYAHKSTPLSLRSPKWIFFKSWSFFKCSTFQEFYCLTCSWVERCRFTLLANGVPFFNQRTCTNVTMSVKFDVKRAFCFNVWSQVLVTKSHVKMWDKNSCKMMAEAKDSHYLYVAKAKPLIGSNQL